MSMGTRVRLACSSGTARDGLDVLPLDGLFQLVALVVAGRRDRRERAAPRGPNNEEPTVDPAPAAMSGLEVDRCSADGTGVRPMHGVCLIDDDGAVVKTLDGRAHRRLSSRHVFAELATFADAASIPVAIERGEGLVVGLIAGAGHPVLMVEPAAFKAARPRWGSAGAKSDLA